MFHYIPVASHAYSTSHLSDLRDRYFAALAVAKAAEADCLAAEAGRREEDDLRRRLAELQYLKEEQVLRSCYHLAPFTYPHTYPSYDRLAILRQQLEEEERYRLLNPRLRRREQVVMESEAAHMRRTREEAHHLKQEQREQACLQALLGQLVKVAEHPYYGAHQTSRSPYRFHELRKQVPSALHPSQHVLLGPEPKVIATVEPVSQAMQKSEALEVFLKQILDSTLATSKLNTSAKTTSKPSASTSEPMAAQDKGILDPQKYSEYMSQPIGRQSASQTTPAIDESLEPRLLQEFAKLLVPPVEETANQPFARTARDTAEQSLLAASVSAPAAPKVPSDTSTQSLKEQLEARLNNEFHSEVRDTIQAIFESLRDAINHGQPTSASPSNKATSSGKGKAKAESTTATSAPSSNPTSKDVVDSFNEVRSIEAAFHALQDDFTFPATLDFISSHLIPVNNYSSDSESSSSTAHLAYTSRNHSVRFYEQALSALLAQLDSVDSFGNDDLRATRKEVVSMVEKALEELETEVEGRYRTRLAKEVKSVPIETTTAPEVSTTITSASSDSKQELTPALEPMVEDSNESTSAPSVSSKPAPTVTLESSLEKPEPSEISSLTTSQTKPVAPASIPTITDALSSSLATVKASEITEDATQVPASPSVENESPDAFLLTAESEVMPKRPNNKDSDDVASASDWSDIEA